MCTGTPGTARNRVKDVSRAAENSAFKELSVKFLELNHTNLHNCLKGLPSLHTYENDQDQAVRKSEHVHLVRVPRCQMQVPVGRPEPPPREIEISNSRVKYRLIHLSTMSMLGFVPESCSFFARAKVSKVNRVQSSKSRVSVYIKYISKSQYPAL